VYPSTQPIKPCNANELSRRRRGERGSNQKLVTLGNILGPLPVYMDASEHGDCGDNESEAFDGEHH
jgi:hypothetical protein